MPEIAADCVGSERAYTGWSTSPFSFPKRGDQDLAAAFAEAHALSERVYRGNGLWEGQLVRLTSRRCIGYLGAAEAIRIPLYAQRAREAADRLVGEQRDDGLFPWYHLSRRGLERGDHPLYDTGIAGVALARAARFFGDRRCGDRRCGDRRCGDRRYADASRRAAEWAAGLPISPNTNYNLFAVWHLCEQYRLDGDPQWLDAAVHKVVASAVDTQLPCGAWPGHNSWIWYHGIVVRGLAALDAALPAGHPARRAVERTLLRAGNRVIEEQGDDGVIPPNPGETHDPHRNAFCLHALLHLADQRTCPAIDNAVMGLLGLRLHGRLSGLASGADADRAAGTDDVEPGEVVWRADLAEAVANRFGIGPRGWDAAWIPGFEPEPGRIRWSMDPCAGARDASFRVDAIGRSTNCGAGIALSDGPLVPGRPYRWEARISVRESPGASGATTFLHASVWSGVPRPFWDLYTGCAIGLETPRPVRWEPVSVDFVAGEANHLYLATHSAPIGSTESIGFGIVDPVIRSIPSLPLPDPGPSPVSALECEVMVLGEAVRSRYGRASRLPAAPRDS